MSGSKAGRPTKPRPARADLARLYAEGLSIREAAESLGVSKDLVARALKEYGLKRRPGVKRSRLRLQDLADIRGKIEALGYARAAVVLGVE
jgi:transposase